jgi:hypothetical protein
MRRRDPLRGVVGGEAGRLGSPWSAEVASGAKLRRMVVVRAREGRAEPW